MPIYEYQCPKCEHAWSDLVSSSSTPNPACPSCGAKKTEKLFSSFASAVSSSPGGAACATGPAPSCGPHNCGCGKFH